jgi:membrane protein YqaA with SNARE-associated domain
MFEKNRERKERFRREQTNIFEEIRDVVYRHRNFFFSHRKKDGFLHQESKDKISKLEAEEFMMRFFGLFSEKSKLWKFLKIIFFTAVVFAVYFNWDKVHPLFIGIIESIPFIKNTVTFIVEALNSRALIGIFLFAFFINLFFITLPDEVYFIIFLIAGHNPIILIPVILAGGLLGLTVDYLIGRAIGGLILRKLLKKKYYKFKFLSDKFGGFFLVVGNIVPSPVQWFSVALGAFGYGYIKFITFSAIGKLSKYMGLTFGLHYFTTTVNPYIEGLKPKFNNFYSCLNETNTSIPFIK